MVYLHLFSVIMSYYVVFSVHKFLVRKKRIADPKLPIPDSDAENVIF